MRFALLVSVGSFLAAVAGAAVETDVEYGRAAGESQSSALEILMLEPAAADACGIGRSGALLARPDGYVAWRTPDERNASSETFSRVLSTVLGLD